MVMLQLESNQKIKNKDFKKNYIIQEYIYGDEFHLDILNDHNGKLSSSLKKNFYEIW